MNIPAILRVFALFLLPAFFVALLAGCGAQYGAIQKAITGESLAVYEPIGESSADLGSAKIKCESKAAMEMAPIVAQQQALAAQRQAAAAKARAAEAQARALRELSSRSRFAQPDPQSAFSGVDFGGFAASFHARAAIQEQQQLLFDSCMTEHGWRSVGSIKFRDVNAPIGGTVRDPEAETGQTPLHVVALHNNADSVSWLISEGADVNVKAAFGGTPLHWTTFEDAVGAAEVLLNHGADVNAQTDEGVSPIQAAAAENSHNVAALLVERGADIHAVSDNDWTPLHTAARNNSREIAGLLIAEGADIEAQGGDNGLTSLHRAAFYGSVETAGLLIARGAKLNAKTYAGETPLDIAKREGKRDVIALLERAARAAARKAESADGESDLADGGDGAESVFENAWRSVVVVVAGDNQGGGVVVNEPNQVATNCHVVDESSSDIRVYKGENRRAVRDAPYSAEVVSEDRERDVCILSVSGLWAIPAKIRSAEELEIGEAVYAVGTPKGLDFSISNGIVSQLREEAGESAPLIQTSAAISPGSSGGGLFDSQGRLVGLTTWKIREGENLNFAIPVDWALELPR